MGLYTKTLWLALPLISGCAAVPQLSSQGPGTNLGGKGSVANRTSLAKELHFPEERAWYKEANREDILAYAKYIKSNVGLSEKDLGMPMLKYRELEKQVAAAEFARDPIDVANEFKKLKYHITHIGPGTGRYPANKTWEEIQSSSDPALVEWRKVNAAEIANFQNTPFSINSDMANYVLQNVDNVLHANKIDTSTGTGRLVRASLFVKGAYYLFWGPGMKRDSLNLTWGGTSCDSDVAQKSIFALDVPRTGCVGFSGSFTNIVNAKTHELGVIAGNYQGYLKGGAQGDIGGRAINHQNAIVTYKGYNIVEAYDPTNLRKLDSRDPNGRAIWALIFNGGFDPYFKTQSFMVGGKRVPPANYRDNDPISSMNREEFNRIPRSLSDGAFQLGEKFH